MRVVAVLLPLGIIVQPAQGHCYSYWAYPHPQNCRGAYARVTQERLFHPDVRPVPVPPVRDLGVDIPLPDLTDIVWNTALETSGQLELMQGMQRLQALEILKEEQTK